MDKDITAESNHRMKRKGLHSAKAAEWPRTQGFSMRTLTRAIACGDIVNNITTIDMLDKIGVAASAQRQQVSDPCDNLPTSGRKQQRRE